MIDFKLLSKFSGSEVGPASPLHHNYGSLLALYLGEYFGFSRHNWVTYISINLFMVMIYQMLVKLFREENRLNDKKP